MSGEPEGFREFVLARSHALLRTAWMLTGDAQAAEDLLQTALARTWPHWERVRQGRPEAYVRTVMVRTNASWRARFWNRERSSDAIDLGAGRTTGRAGGAAGEYGQVDDRLLLLAALAKLPVRQRQAVVLRYFDDLSVEVVAQMMGSSAGTVKSQTSKGLTKLKALIGMDTLVQEEL